MLIASLVIAATVAAFIYLMRPSVRTNVMWGAMITPLASIIGSGFLILGPVLNDKFGGYAPLIMLGLCVVSYFFGAAVRRNIVTTEWGAGRDPQRKRLDSIGGWALAFSYMISLPYYLNVMGAFAVSLTPFDGQLYGRIVATAAFILILLAGWLKGFDALEEMEKYSVSIKLAIIVGLLVGMAAFFVHKASAGQLAFAPATIGGWHAVAVCFGLVVTVQGFETSRYLGLNYSARDRAWSMHWAQIISSVIYMIYIVLLVYAIPPDGSELTDTSVIGMMKQVSFILPPLLVLSALVAQFGGAVADTAGAGGLIEERSGGRISARLAYAILAIVGVILTWSANVFELVAYASRAFAFYYGVEALIAARNAWRGDRRHAFGFYAIAILAVLVVIFGRPAE